MRSTSKLFRVTALVTVLPLAGCANLLSDWLDNPPSVDDGGAPRPDVPVDAGDLEDAGPEGPELDAGLELDAGVAPLPQDDAGPPPPVRDDAGPPPPVRDDAGPPPPVRDDAGPPPPVRDDAGPLPPVRDDAGPTEPDEPDEPDAGVIPEPGDCVPACAAESELCVEGQCEALANLVELRTPERIHVPMVQPTEIDAELVLNDGRVVDVTSECAWTSSDLEYLPVGEPGVVTAWGSGDYVVEASFGPLSSSTVVEARAWVSDVIVNEVSEVDLAVSPNGSARIVYVVPGVEPGSEAIGTLWYHGELFWGYESIILERPAAISTPRLALSDRGDRLLVFGDAASGHRAMGTYASFQGPWVDPPVLLDTVGTAANVTDVAVSHVGSGLAAFAQLDPDSYVGAKHVYAASLSTATGWQPEGLAIPYGVRARVAVNASGDGVIVAASLDGEDSSVRLAPFVRGVGVDAYVSIAAPRLSFGPEVAMDAAGNAILVWAEQRNDGNRVRAARYEPGAGIVEVVELVNNGERGLNFPVVAMNVSGHAVMVWEHFDGARRVYGARYTPGEGFGHVHRYSGPDDQHVVQPRVAVDDRGDAIVAWLDYAPTSRRARITYETVLGRLSPAETLESATEPRSLDDLELGVARRPGFSREAIVTWVSWHPSGPRTLKFAARR